MLLAMPLFYSRRPPRDMRGRVTPMPGMKYADAPPVRTDFTFRDFAPLDEQRGTFKGYLAVIGNEDDNGDIIDPGAFAKTIAELKAKQTKRLGQGAPAARYLLPILW